jgi:hypothetical protein
MGIRHRAIALRACAAYLAIIGISASYGCSAGGTQDRDVHGTELALGPIQLTSTQILPDETIALRAYAQVGQNRSGSVSFPERPLLWECSAGTLSLDPDALQNNPGDWTDATEVSAAVGQVVYWRAPQQKGLYDLSVKMADLSQFRLLEVVDSLERMTIETPTLTYALGQINVPPTSLKPNQVIELSADAEVLVFGQPPTPGDPEYERTWSCNAGKLAETSAALSGLGSSPDLMKPSTLTTRRSGVIYYRTPPQAGVYFITLKFHRMEQEALIFVVAGP